MQRYINDIPFNMIHLCIDESNEYQIKGRAYNSTIENPLYFEDMNDVFLKFDHIFDKNGNPLAWQSHRSFKQQENMTMFCYKPKEVMGYKRLLEYHGKMMTFDIVVKSRMASEWQGILYYQDQAYEYQSIGELIKKIIYALED